MLDGSSSVHYFDNNIAFLSYGSKNKTILLLMFMYQDEKNSSSGKAQNFSLLKRRSEPTRESGLTESVCTLCTYSMHASAFYQKAISSLTENQNKTSEQRQDLGKKLFGERL